MGWFSLGLRLGSNFENGSLKAEPASELGAQVVDRQLNPLAYELALVLGNFVLGQGIIEGVDEGMLGSEIQTGQNLLGDFALFALVGVGSFADNLYVDDHVMR